MSNLTFIRPARALRRESHHRLDRQFLTSESGATAIEYGLIASLIAVSLIGALRLTGNRMKTTFNCARIAIDNGGKQVMPTGVCARMQAS